jgi:hypothetical protein
LRCKPLYLTVADVLELHALIIGATAAEAAHQLRNRSGLESALARPETYAHYQGADVALQAAVLAHGIAPAVHRRRQAHGADRHAHLVEINGWRVEAPGPELANLIVSFSAGATPESVAELVASLMRTIN